MRLNPVVEAMRTYPFVRIDEAKNRVRERGVELIDFGMGEPREETPPFIRRALAEAVEAHPVSTYPLSVGLPGLREAIAAWVERRYGAALDPGIEVIPTLGSKEAIFHLAQVVGRPGDAVGVPTPAYPVPARGAALAGLDVIEVPLRAEHGWLPDPAGVPWERLALLWLNSPNNPTGSVAPLALLEELAARCREHDVLLACDEAYSELWFGERPPPSGLQLADRTNVAVFNTLSKRSSMPGYRSGFVAGDPALIAALKRFRPSIGTAPQEFVQRASIAAWSDEEHVTETRERYAAKREVMLPAFARLGLEHVGGDASFFVWLRVPDGDDEALATRLLEDLGVVVTPGSYLGAGGEGHVRAALVPTLENCRRAAALLADTAASRA